MATSKARLELDNSQFIQAIRQAETAIAGLKAEAQTFSSRISESFSGMNIAATALGATLVGLGGAVMHYADEITDMADAHGESVVQIMALAKALDQTGGKSENAGKLYQALANKIQEANQGNLKTVATFNSLGVSIAQLGSASEREIRDKLIRSIGEIQDPATRSAMAMDIFGKAAQNVDFTKLADSIDKNANKLADAGPAMIAAADAMDKLKSIMGDIKVAAAQAFYPLFLVLKDVKISTDVWVVGLKAATVALAALASATIVKGIFNIAAAFAALSPAGRVISLLAGGAAALASSLGLFGKASEAYDKLTGSADKNTAAVVENNQVKRDTSAISAAQEKEAQTIRKVTDAYLLQNQAVNDKLVAELQGLSQTEEQQKIAKARIDAETIGQKALLDLKTQFLSLDADGQKRQMDNYLKQQSIIKDNISLQIRGTTSQIANIESQKRLISDQAAASGLFADQYQKEAKARSELASAMQSLETRNRIEANYNLILQDRSILSKTARDLLPSPQAEKFGAIVAEASKSLTNYSGSAAEMAARHRELVVSLAREQGFTDEQIKSIYQYSDAQMQAAQAVADRAEATSNMMVRAAEQTNLYNFGLKQQFDLENKVADLVYERSRLAMPELAKKYDDIAISANKLAQTEIQAAQYRLGRRLSVEEQITYYNAAYKGTEKLKDATRSLYLESRTFATGWKQAMNSYIEDVTNGANTARNIFSKATQGMEDSIINFVKTGKFQWRDFVNSMLEELLRSQIRQIFAQTMNSMMPGTGKSSSGGGSIIGDIWNFGKSLLGFANGGTIPTNGPVIVGERGPELLYGAGGMTVNPNLGGSTMVTYNISAVDAQSFQALIARDPGFIHAVAEQGRRRIPSTRR